MFQNRGFEEMGKIREHMVFTGRVQGVGFRYKAKYLAQHYGVTGWVCNRHDGSVEAQMQGREEDLDKVLQSLQQDAYIRIDWVVRNRLELDPKERRFSVKY